jgi:hypothetical protein
MVREYIRGANASAAERLQLRRLERVELWQNENAVADS